jgi:HK97 family phage prohead protease
MAIETRSFFKSELRAAAGDEMALEGRAVTYEAMSAPMQGFRERVARGAFTKSLANSKQNVIADFNHDERSLPLGTTQAGTLKLKDGPDGLDFRCVLDPNQEAHRSLYSAVQRGDISCCSWAFNIDGADGEDWDQAQDEEGRSYNRRTVKRAILHGVSVVLHPAYPGDATSVSARNLDAGLELFELRQRLAAQGVQINNDAEWLALKARALQLEKEIWK